jgi:hypothetical protein
MHKLIVAALWAALLIAGMAGAQTANPLCVDGPSAPTTMLTPGPAAGETLAKVCTSVSDLPLDSCAYQIGTTVRTLAAPQAGKQYVLTFPAATIARGETKPFTAQCFAASGPGEVRTGTATFPNAPAAPILLP